MAIERQNEILYIVNYFLEGCNIIIIVSSEVYWAKMKQFGDFIQQVNF